MLYKRRCRKTSSKKENELLLMKLAYEVGKLDFKDDAVLKIPLPVNYKEMSEENLKSLLESDGE